MEITDNLICLYSAKVEEQDGKFVIEVPTSEVTVGDVEPGAVTRVALLSPRSPESSEEKPEQQQDDGQQPPVEQGEQRTVEIEDIGEQGDGIARVERGYVVIVPDTDQGERVTAEIKDVRENVAFAEVVERKDYFG